jgi:glycosylphosphatidylinositol deacylase
MIALLSLHPKGGGMTLREDVANENRLRYVTNLLFFFLAVYAGVYGVTYAYLLHHLVNIVAAWLVAIYFSTSGFSLSGFTRLLEGEDYNGEGDVKKRP